MRIVTVEEIEAIKNRVLDDIGVDGIQAEYQKYVAEIERNEKERKNGHRILHGKPNG
jgi:hypothetical protein